MSKPYDANVGIVYNPYEFTTIVNDYTYIGAQNHIHEHVVVAILTFLFHQIVYMLTLFEIHISLNKVITIVIIFLFSHIIS